MSCPDLLKKSEYPETINVQVWWKSGGGMMVRRDCLPHSHPEHTYNYILREFKVRPESFGVERPLGHSETCPSCGYEFYPCDDGGQTKEFGV